ncbi:Uncharacterised protein [Brucella neotomae]|nr:Uncharacterised protein [Brucella neotomae]
MGTDIAGCAAQSRLHRIGAPDSPFRAGRFNRFGEPVLRIFHLYDTKIAKVAIGNHFARLPHHGIAGVIMRQDEQRAAFICHLLQLLRIGKGRGQRLVADDMDATPQKLLGGVIMNVVWRYDGNGLDTVFQPRFTNGHVLVAGINAVFGQPQLATGSLHPFRRGRQRAGHQIETVIKPRRHAVYTADESPCPPPTMPRRMRDADVSLILASIVMASS